MQPEDIRTLIDRGESLTCEFKRGSINDKALVEAVMCLANGEGGTLLIGVEDDGTVTGATPRHGRHTNTDLIQALVLNKTSPPCAVVAWLAPFGDQEILVIEVEPADTPTGTTDGVYKRRTIQTDGSPQCVPYLPNEMFSRHFSLRGRDFAEVPAREATLDDLSPREFDRFRRKAAEGTGDRVLASLDDGELGRALGVIRDNGSGDREITIGAILLFGRDHIIRKYVPNAEVAFQELNDDLSVRTNQISTSPLIRAADHLREQVMLRNPEEELTWGMLRVAIPRIPESAVREVVANALIHRDYAEQGAIRVQIDSEKFTVYSPGGFPPGVTIDNLLDVSQPRSRILADAFKRAGMVERTGRGIGIMYRSLLRIGRDTPHYGLSSPQSVMASISIGPADIEMARFIVAREHESGTPMKLRELQIMHELRQLGSASLEELSTATRSTVDATRHVITHLVQQGLVEVRGAGRSREYHLASAFFRYAEDREGYIRVRGVEGNQHEQMILQFVRAHGEITRADAARLCMLNATSASRLLRRLAAEGKLELQGERRWSRYVTPGSTPRSV